MAEEGKKSQGDINNEFNSANSGMNMDLTPSQIPKGALTYALNANVENFDANGINYQNEPGNEFCFEFPKNYTLIGTHFIQERSKHIFFLANPFTGESEIGYMDNNDCIYKTLINADCLNFDINHPIPKIVHRVTNCTTEIYWPDQNGRRYLDIDNIPYMLAFGSEICNPIYSKELDCNQLNIQPNFSIPQLEVTDVMNGGNIIAGTVQFAFQYSDALGNGYTSFYSVTNPTPIADTSIITVNFNYPVGKSVVLKVSNIELSGKFKHFNIAVIKTVNDISSVELVGTYFIEEGTKEITYSGQSVSNIRLTMADIFEKFPIYGAADDITTVSDILVWKGLSSTERINYQSIASKITLQWETWRIPPGENYADEWNATNLRGYMRDEVYAFEFVPILRSGKQTDGFHIPGKLLTETEKTLPPIVTSNPDYVDDEDTATVPYWKVYNTATVLGKSPGYSPDDDYKGPFEYGEFSYWESSEEYPCEDDLWGDLAGQPIRHHKFPDVAISPIFESKIFSGIPEMEMGDTAVFPIGVKISIEQIRKLIADSNLTKEQKADIVGFKIARGNRGTNKSVIAKGILRNVNTYEREEQEFYFANYPYNDLNSDPFINAENNAYREECEPFDIYIYRFNDTDDLGPFVAIQYNDCNTNKLKTIKYRELASSPPIRLCSVGKPTMLGPGTYNGVAQHEEGPSYSFHTISTTTPVNVVAIKYANYDIYHIHADGFLCKGFKVQFEDAVAGTATAFIDPTINFNNPLNPDELRVHVIAKTVPILVSKNRKGCTEEIDFSGSVRVEACVKDEPIEPAKDNPTLAYRQVFNSPETSFGQPFLGDVLKVESVIFGRGRAHFVEVKDNAKYRLLTYEAQEDALNSAKEVGYITQPFNAAAMFAVYQSYLTIYVNGITKKNYAMSFNSRADYSYSIPVPDLLGVKQRRVDLRKYLIPVVQNVGETLININNYQRETSVYMRTEGTEEGETTPALPFPDKSPLFLNETNGLTEYSRFTIGCTEGNPNCTASCANPAQEKDIRVVSYYASIKNIFRGQWGQMYSYETIDTGFQRNLFAEEATSSTVFGGDTFITRFAFKTKVPFFIDNRVGAPDESDIFYDELGNIGYPKFWHSARSILKDYSMPSLGNLTNIISYKAHNFDCPNRQQPKSSPGRTYYDGYFYLFAYGIPNFYVESSYNVDLRQAFNNKEGEFWPHVSTGIPDDWVQESFVSIQNDNTYNYNVTYSKQNKENYFSHLPPDWSDKKCFTVYPFRAVYSERETADADNRVNSWLTYRATSHFDFPQNYGRLTSIDGIDNQQLLARFENKSLLYNALYTNQTNTGGQVYLGQILFSDQPPPFDFAETDLGYMGSQHKFLLKVPQGQISIDAKRGQVFLIVGKQIKDLGAPGTGMNRFFTDHLAFEILRYFPSYEITDPVTKERITVPGVNIDNHFKDIGLHGVYDSKYDRVIITKLDYIPIDSRVKFDSALQEFYIEEELPIPEGTSTTTSTSSTSSTTSTSSTSSTSSTTSTSTTLHVIKRRIPVFLTDPEYFCNKSWTLSYSFVTNSWISFHSYLPNWYIGENNFFYSGIATCCDDDIDFTFIGGELVPNPSTTTTTSSSTSSTSSTTTTSTTFNCVLVGGTVQNLGCDLAGTAIITVPPAPTPCLPPPGLEAGSFTVGYITLSPYAFFDTTATSTDACNGIVQVNSGDPNIASVSITMASENLLVGAEIFTLANSSDPCEKIPDGWYSYPLTEANGTLYHVVGGVIVELFTCVFPTTTSTTSTVPLPTFVLRVENTQPTGSIDGVFPPFYTMNLGEELPILSGETKTGLLTTGGDTITVQYTAADAPVLIEIYRNNVLVIPSTELPVGVEQYVAFDIDWNDIDSIEIRLK